MLTPAGSGVSCAAELTVTSLSDAPVGEGGVAGSAVRVTSSQGPPSLPVTVWLSWRGVGRVAGGVPPVRSGGPWAPEASGLAADGAVMA